MSDNCHVTAVSIHVLRQHSALASARGWPASVDEQKQASALILRLTTRAGKNEDSAGTRHGRVRGVELVLSEAPPSIVAREPYGHRETEQRMRRTFVA